SGMPICLMISAMCAPALTFRSRLRLGKIREYTWTWMRLSITSLPVSVESGKALCPQGRIQALNTDTRFVARVDKVSVAQVNPTMRGHADNVNKYQIARYRIGYLDPFGLALLGADDLRAV